MLKVRCGVYVKIEIIRINNKAYGIFGLNNNFSTINYIYFLSIGYNFEFINFYWNWKKKK